MPSLIGKRLGHALKYMQAHNAELIESSRDKDRKRSLVSNHQRRARLDKVKPLVLEEWELVQTYYGRACLCCGKQETTMDHIVPLVQQGGNEMENLQPLCKRCNSRKHARIEDYRWDNGEWLVAVREDAGFYA